MSKSEMVNEKSIRMMYRRDCALLAVFVAAMWSILTPVMLTVLDLAPNGTVKAIVICVAVISGAALTWGMLAVFFHIRRNRDTIYKEDLENLAVLKGQKGKEDPS
ncbi:MAG: hypothetical protein HFG41_07055 [Coprococcus sp.]|nr:hypothetical protein [Coprococcus sp.]